VFQQPSDDSPRDPNAIVGASSMRNPAAGASLDFETLRGGVHVDCGGEVSTAAL
jgi:hypothetical protein